MEWDKEITPEQISEDGRKYYQSGLTKRSPEQMRKDGKKGGKIGGRIVVDLQLGVHGLSSEEHSKNGRKGGERVLKLGIGYFGRSLEQILIDSRKGTIAQGNVPWIKKGDMIREGIYCSIDELERAFYLSKQPKYQFGSKVSIIKIRDVLNNNYHNGEEVRTSYSIAKKLCNYRKTLRE